MAVSIVGGIITEKGGMLSHGAIIEREYNVPTVETGQKLKVKADITSLTV
uniref:PEP-utilising enzyme mobile domain-containing protein n=1 Tax=candidate division WOR-3 bacterium TaxID=2052148 RepID=A0A7C2K1J1_UNCW3